MTPAPDHSEETGTGQPRLGVQQEAGTPASQRRLEAVLEDGEGEVTTSMPGLGDQEQAARGTAARPEKQEVRGKTAVAGRQTKRVVREGMEVGKSQEAVKATKRLEEVGREAQEEAEAVLTVFSRPVLTPVQGRARGCLGPV